MTGVRVITEPLGGSTLARLAITGNAPPDWYPPPPRTAEEWGERAEQVRSTAAPNWLTPLLPAFGARLEVPERLRRVAAAGGVVVTTGQQAGLFGGPLYTWSKALSALALADVIERETGVPTAPVFWAATDDADFQEASRTWIALPGGERELALPASPSEGTPMSDVPLGDVSVLIGLLFEGAGSAVDPSVLALLRRSYDASSTVGGAYVALLRALLVPLGVAVLDAASPAVAEAGRKFLTTALRRSRDVASALAERSAALRAARHDPQVAEVEGLSLVFSREDGRKVRVPIAEADDVAGRGASEFLSANVLLRPVLERVLLPTVAYMAGPGELAYFAQVSAVAASLEVPAPLALPRWSGTILEPQVEALLARLGVGRDELAIPHAVEGRLARTLIPEEVAGGVRALRESVEAGAGRLADTLRADGLLDPRIVEGVARQLSWRIDRFERRLLASAKRRHEETMRDVATLRGALWPRGGRQERVLNAIPFLARHGPSLLATMRAEAGAYADTLVAGAALPSDAA
jgi:bacillithiol synthase